MVVDFCLCLYLIYKARKAEKEIVTPRQYENREETFCLLTLKVMIIVRVILIIVCVNSFIFFTAYAVGPNYLPWFATQEFIDCDKSSPKLNDGVFGIFIDIEHMTI